MYLTEIFVEESEMYCIACRHFVGPLALDLLYVCDMCGQTTGRLEGAVLTDKKKHFPYVTYCVSR
jgi:Zn finger protein HypA/HybF involved in hydrogenase expression